MKEIKVMRFNIKKTKAMNDMLLIVLMKAKSKLWMYG